MSYCQFLDIYGIWRDVKFYPGYIIAIPGHMLQQWSADTVQGQVTKVAFNLYFIVIKYRQFFFRFLKHANLKPRSML